MKFVIIQCAEAYHYELEQIFKEIHINAYSEMNVEGFMKNVDGNVDISNWFGSEKKPYRYIVSFAFLMEDKANELLERINDFNDDVKTIRPVNAYVVGIEKYV